jgi:hypothetical protein
MYEDEDDDLVGFTSVQEGDDVADFGNGVIQGGRGKFTKEGKWIDAHGNPLPEGSWLVIGVAKFEQKWVPGEKSAAVVRRVAANEPFRNMAQLNSECPSDEWCVRFGKNQGPWQAVHVIYLLNETSLSRISWPSRVDTVGSRLCVNDLVGKMQWARKLQGVKVYPRAQLSTMPMPTRSFGIIPRPHFEITGWVAAGESPALAPPGEAQVQLPPPATPAPVTAPPVAAPVAAAPPAGQKRRGARPINPPTAAEEMGDKVPY